MLRWKQVFGDAVATFGDALFKWPVLIHTWVFQTRSFSYGYDHRRQNKCHSFPDIWIIKLGWIFQSKRYMCFRATPTCLIFSHERNTCGNNEPCGLREEIHAPRSPSPALSTLPFWRWKVDRNLFTLFNLATCQKSSFFAVSELCLVTLV